MSWIKLILVCSNIPIYATAALAAFRYNQLNQPFRVFSWYLFTSAMVQTVAVVLWFFSINNLFLNHLFVPISAVCIAVFYQQLLATLISGNIIRTVLVLFIVASIANSVWIQPISTFNSYALALQSVLVVILSLATFLLLLNHGHHLSGQVDMRYVNWINSGLFIYYGSGLILFYFSDIIISSLSLEANRYVWLLHSLFYIIMCTCFFIGLWKRLRI